jgi:YegS/Rv2252/BmrU family lipid kinase
VQRAHLILKPVAVPEVGGDPAPHVVARLRESGIQCAVTYTQRGRSVGEDVRDALAAPDPPDVVIAAGGDGTHGPAAAALMGRGVPLGLLALGTFNNLARSLGIPRQFDAALDVIVGGAPRLIDAGRVNGRLFFEAAGAGWDATLFPLGDDLKRGRVAGMVSAARSVLGFRPGEITLVLDGTKRVTSHTPTVVVANGPYFGSSMAIAPGSRLDDGRLTVTLFEGFSRADLLAYFAAVGEGRRRADARVVSHHAAHVEIVSPAGLPVHADGEPLGPLRTPFEVLPQAVAVLAPPDRSAQGAARTEQWVRPQPGGRESKARDRTTRWQRPAKPETEARKA